MPPAAARVAAPPAWRRRATRTQRKNERRITEPNTTSDMSISSEQSTAVSHYAEHTSLGSRYRVASEGAPSKEYCCYRILLLLSCYCSLAQMVLRPWCLVVKSTANN